MVLIFFCCYSKDSMKKGLVTQEVALIIIKTPMDGTKSMDVDAIFKWILVFNG